MKKRLFPVLLFLIFNTSCDLSNSNIQNENVSSVNYYNKMIKTNLTEDEDIWILYSDLEKLVIGVYAKEVDSNDTQHPIINRILEYSHATGEYSELFISNEKERMVHLDLVRYNHSYLISWFNQLEDEEELTNNFRISKLGGYHTIDVYTASSKNIWESPMNLFHYNNYVYSLYKDGSDRNATIKKLKIDLNSLNVELDQHIFDSDSVAINTMSYQKTENSELLDVQLNNVFYVAYFIEDKVHLIERREGEVYGLIGELMLRKNNFTNKLDIFNKDSTIIDSVEFPGEIAKFSVVNDQLTFFSLNEVLGYDAGYVIRQMNSVKINGIKFLDGKYHPPLISSDTLAFAYRNENSEKGLIEIICEFYVIE